MLSFTYTSLQPIIRAMMQEKEKEAEGNPSVCSAWKFLGFGSVQPTGSPVQIPAVQPGQLLGTRSPRAAGRQRLMPTRFSHSQGFSEIKPGPSDFHRTVARGFSLCCALKT